MPKSLARMPARSVVLSVLLGAHPAWASAAELIRLTNDFGIKETTLRDEVGEQRILAGSAVTVTGVALRLAAEEIVSRLLLRSELCFVREHRIKLRGKTRHLGGSFIASNGLRHLIERAHRSSAVDCAEVNRQRITRGRRAGAGTNLLHIVRPCDREGLLSPHEFKQSAIRPLRGPVDRTGYIGQAHFHRVGRGALGLLGCGVA
jgi:hypothetical protein